MRIITAREQVEMLAPWSQRHAGVRRIAVIFEAFSLYATVTEDLLHSLSFEFADWAGQNDKENPRDKGIYYKDQRGPIGHWPHVEDFLKENYPAAHRGLEFGFEQAQPLLDESETSFAGATGDPYETGPEAHAQYGYDPKEIAAGMLLLHNKTHHGRQEMRQHDQDRLTDIAQKRYKMQRDSDQRNRIAFRYARLLAGFDPTEVTNRLRNEFYDWHEQQPPSEDGTYRSGEDIDNNPIGHWPTVEKFLEHKYPAAHRGFAMGMEDASQMLDHPNQQHDYMHMDDDIENGDEGSHFDLNDPPKPYQTNYHTIKQLGYDPEEIAAGMLLLHNKAHGSRGGFLNEDKGKLVDIFKKRQEMQRNYEKSLRPSDPNQLTLFGSKTKVQGYW